MKKQITKTGIQFSLQGAGALALLAFLIFLMEACANPVAPTGGPRDEEPPVLDTLASSPLLPVNFTKKDITLEFDEFIELDNPATSIVISPPLQERPEFRVRGRRLIMSFHDDEELLENTTYTINFGDAIRDITERNILKNFLYVFSTGSFIDSLELRVNVTEAFTGLPAEGVIAMLHLWSAGDSAIVKEKPVYFAVTDKNGMAHLQYMRADSFRLFALQDQNRNYILDLAGEKSGFHADPIILPENSGETIEISIYQRKERLFSSSRRWRDGSRYSLIYNRPPTALEFDFPDLDIPFVSTHHGDTIAFHFGPNIITDSLMLVTTEINEGTDTVRIAPPRNTEIAPLRKSKISANLLPREKALVRFNHLLDSFNRDSILYVDTVIVENQNLRDFTFSSDSLLLNLELEGGKRGEWILLPGAVTDIFGQTNDSIRLNFSRQSSSALAQLDIIIQQLDSAQQYIFKLEDQRENVVRSVVVSGKNEFNWNLANIRPDRYTLRVIEDVNRNRIWDPGHPVQRRQAEQIKVFNVIELRANWEFEQIIETGFFTEKGEEEE